MKQARYLVELCYQLNKNVPEIGAGMLANIVKAANEAKEEHATIINDIISTCEETASLDLSNSTLRSFAVLGVMTAKLGLTNEQYKELDDWVFGK